MPLFDFCNAIDYLLRESTYVFTGNFRFHFSYDFK